MKQYPSLLLIASLLHVTISSVYFVMPDNHYHPINNNTYTLQHYLNNTNKYFTSNIQLHFLPGQYYLNNDLIIQGVSNFSFIGNRTSEVINTVINCTSPAGIVVVGSSNIVIANFIINDCGNEYTTFLNYYISESNITELTSLFFLQSKLITCMYLYSNKGPGGIKFINPLINTKLSKLITNYLVIWFNEYTDNTNHTFYINKIQFHDNNTGVYSVQVKQFNASSNISVIIQCVIFTNSLALHIMCVNCTGHSSTIISNCNFTSNLLYYDYYDYDDLYYEFEDDNTPICDYDDDNLIHISGTVHVYYQDCVNVYMPNKMQLINCFFVNNNESNFIQITQIVRHSHLRNNLTSLMIVIRDCIFHNNQYTRFLSLGSYSDDLNYHTLLLIKNTTLSSNMHFTGALVFVYQTKVEIDQVKVISNVGTLDPCYDSAIFMAKESYLQFRSHNYFFNNTVIYVICAFSAHIQEESATNFILNTFVYAIYTMSTMYTLQLNILKTCPIQYISTRGILDKQFQQGDELNYSVIFSNNSMIAISNSDMMHCTWDSHSAFSTSSRPALVNKRFVTYNYNNDEHDYICLCPKNKTKNCHNKDFGPLYPGQTILFDLILADTGINGTEKALVNAVDQSDITCKHVKDKSTVYEFQYDECKRIGYAVKYHYRGWCELSLLVRDLPSMFESGVETYTILFQPCPKGFSLYSEGYCQCDTILSSHIPSLTHCNIDDQTIPRPANTWISAHTVNNSHSYHVSLHCPFDYCLPHSSHLNLSTPDSQCQFSRSGLLCGQCQQGLSAVFGSSQCKPCSNIYLLIIIPIAIAGLLLVLLLFVLNLTVTDGNINPFLLSVNIISINNSTIFPTNKSVMSTFVSVANLDLGIETCFYDGMDEYAKRWLQLVFPAYLIFIAMLIIITSRYSTRMQRLTAHRALPVLATLFLLSYTKVLLTISNVLFYYSTITYLPSIHTITVWAVETSVSLFGLKFIMLFITCLLLFIILIPFNIILIFTRTLSYFRVVTYFKPLLDAYQGPYKIKYYYWTGLQLVFRAIFFGLSALDRDINLMISIILLGVIICLQKVLPFIKNINNVMEMLSLLNLQVIFVMAYYVNDIMINAAVSLLMFQLICIILLHIKIFLCNGTDFTEIILNKLGKWLPHFGKQGSQRSIELNSVVPEVVYNYKEFQEPLIGQD